MKFKKMLVILLILLLGLPSFALESPLSISLNSPSEYKAGEAIELEFHIKNNSSEILDNLYSQIYIGQDGLLEIQGNKDGYNYSLEAGEEASLAFTFASEKDVHGPANISLITTHEHLGGTEECPLGDRFEIINSITLNIIEADDDDDDDDDYYYDYGGGGGSDGYYDGSSDHKNKPKLIISKYQIEPQMPRAGESFTMTLTFHNTNSEKSCRNIKIYLTSDGSTDGEGLASGGVFTPVGSSNTFYIDYIAPGESKEKTISFHTMPTAPSKNYTMSANFEYEDYQGTELKATELIGIPVVQISKIQVDEPILSEMGPGGPVMVDLNFYNTGRDNLTNFMVSLEGDGFSADEMRYFVGNFQTGSSDSFSTTLYPHEEGEYKGKIVISYEDSTGSPHSLEKEFEGYYSMMNFGDFEEFPMDESNKSGLVNNLIVPAAIVVGLISIAALVLKRRKNKKRQEELDLSEHN